MNTAHTIDPAAVSHTRPMYWSVQREVWEHQSIYVAPLVAAAVYLAGFLISTIHLPRNLRGLGAPLLSHQHVELAMPYAHAAMLVMVVTFLVGVFYSLDALQGERRNRSILFWKSLPVSDFTTVLSKASIPLVVLPLLTFLISLAVELIMLIGSCLVLSLSGTGTAILWAKLPFFQMEVGLLYGVIVLALWHAPIYAWLLLVSGWARRAAFLWALLPLITIGVFEKVAFRTSYFGMLLRDRLLGFDEYAFNLKLPDGSSIDPHFIPLTQFTPGRFLSSPGLWFGLVFAAICLMVAVRLRRYRDPL
jgi:ABC-2 type transport system permease protein